MRHRFTVGARSYWHDMSTRHRSRSVLSGILMAAILSCAQTSLATPLLLAHTMQCRAAMLQAHQPAMPSSCRHQASTAPCCPSHKVATAFNCMDRPGCCKLSNPPALPLPFLIVSRARVAPELSASRSAAFDPDLPRCIRSALPASNSPPSAKPVFHQKADLRI
jgi:hypothetical protein